MKEALDLLGLVAADAIWSAVAALGFAILFNVPRRVLPGALIAGALGHAVRTISMRLGASLELGSLVGALCVGLYGTLAARYWRAPKALFTIPGVIPMVPGALAYRTMLGLISVTTALPPDSSVLLTDALVNGIRTAVILGALAGGIAAPTLLLYRQKPVV